MTIEKLPWQVAVIASSPGGNVSLCGGTLVTSTVVLTAAHCVADGGKVVNDNPSRYRIVSGRTHLLATDEGAVTMPSEIRVPRDAQGNQLFDPQSFAWDVALVRLPVTAPGGTPIQIAGSADAEAWRDEVLLVGATSFVQKESCKDFPHGFARVAADPILAWVHENVLAMTDENIMNVPDEG